MTFLQLLQLADSALPIGTTAHSFGLETLTSEEEVCVEQLVAFCSDYLIECGTLECTFCLLSYRLVQASADGDIIHNMVASEKEAYIQTWLTLNMRLSAYKPARESRTASATLGRRLLQLAASLEELPVIQTALTAAKQQHIETHYSTAFGLVASLLTIDEEMTLLAYLQQTLSALLSTSQRLLPLGQSQASNIQWHLKPLMVEVIARSQQMALDPASITTFTPLLDLGSMRHPTLTTRLFIS
ncbi:urease accessory protein UreF [Ktedonobacteria bacterium brp13]|nr:urease accessory protein UreF [Ktedonobacteria bacterium brp13]